MHETYEYLKNILFSSDVKYLSATKHCISLDAIDANIQVPNKYYARGTFLYMSKFLHCTKKSNKIQKMNLAFLNLCGVPKVLASLKLSPLKP